MQNTWQKTYAHGKAAPKNLKSERFLTKKVSKFINENVVVQIMFYFPFAFYS